jgi:hypothetical protein
MAGLVPAIHVFGLMRWVGEGASRNAKRCRPALRPPAEHATYHAIALRWARFAWPTLRRGSLAAAASPRVSTPTNQTFYAGHAAR